MNFKKQKMKNSDKIGLVSFKGKSSVALQTQHFFSSSFNVKSVHNFQKVAILKTEHFLSRTDSNFIKKIEADGKYLRMLFFPGIEENTRFYYYCEKLKQ